MVSARMSGKPTLYGLLALSAMEVVASQSPDAPLALLQQPNPDFDASTVSVAIAPALPSSASSALAARRSPSQATSPSVEAAPSFAPAAHPDVVTNGPSSVGLARSSQAAIAATTHFQDVQAHWAQPFVELLAARGIVSGYGDGTFQPDRQIEAAHFGSMLRQAKLYRLRALRRELGITSVSATGKAAPQTLTAAVLPPIAETEATRLLQTHDIRTRAQAAVFIYRNFQPQSVLGSAASHGAMNSKFGPVKQISMRAPSHVSVAQAPGSMPFQPSSEMNFSAQFSDRNL